MLTLVHKYGIVLSGARNSSKTEAPRKRALFMPDLCRESVNILNKRAVFFETVSSSRHLNSVVSKLGKIQGAFNMQNLITFENKPINLITINDNEYIEGALLGDTLELKKGNRAVQQIFRKHKKEFTPDMAISIDLPTKGGMQLARVFSLRGASLIAMYAQTPVANRFRAFILDILEGKKQPKDTERLIKKLQFELLKTKPIWQKIYKYKSLGLNNVEVGRLLKVTKRTISGHLRQMEELGIIEPPKNLNRLQSIAYQYLPIHQEV